MKTIIQYYWEWLRTSFWFIPSVMALGAVVLSLLAVHIDHVVHRDIPGVWSWLGPGGPDGARGILSTIAGSMITVAGVVFSIITVPLVLASSQFGPRLLRNFIRDRSNQFVLGTFIATYIYCLLVLRAVRDGDLGVFVPELSISVAILLAICSLGVLIYFIHHVATTIQATQVITGVSHELKRNIEHLFPRPLGNEAPVDPEEGKEALPPEFEHEARPLVTRHTGYLIAVDDDGLMRLAEDYNLILRLERRPGHFIIQGTTVALVWPSIRVNDELLGELLDMFYFGAQRTALQDMEFTIDQLVEVAVRALSPGINDPFTAMQCIDRLGEAMALLADRAWPSPYRFDEKGSLRVVAYPLRFELLCDASFHLIRQYGSSSVAVQLRLLETMTTLCHHTRRPGDREAIKRHAGLVRAISMERLPEEAAAESLDERYREFLDTFEATNPPD